MKNFQIKWNLKIKKLFTVNHFWTSLSSATWLLKSFFHTSPNFPRPFSFVIYPFLSLPFLSSFTSSTHLPWTSLLLLFLLSMFIFLLSRLPLSSSYITLSLLSSFNINSQESPFDSSLLLFSSPSTPAFFFLFEALSSHLPCQTLIPPSLPLLFLSPFILSPSLFPLFLPGIPSSSLSLSLISCILQCISLPVLIKWRKKQHIICAWISSLLFDGYEIIQVFLGPGKAGSGPCTRKSAGWVVLYGE